MARFWVIAAVIAAAFMIYSLVDCAMTDRGRVRGPRKGLWFLIILLPVVGGVLWFLIGRGRGSSRPGTRTIAPDDDPAFLRRLAHDADQEERIRRLEQELSDLDADGPPPGERLAEPDKDTDGGDKPDRRDA
jgi:Phospholipase_D-nuclease N-terminal